MAQQRSAQRKLTGDPKLGVLGWGLAGGFVMGPGMPGALLGTMGVALFFLGATKSLAQGLPLLALAFFFMSALLVGAGYMRYSSAYDREAENLEGAAGQPG